MNFTKKWVIKKKPRRCNQSSIVVALPVSPQQRQMSHQSCQKISFESISKIYNFKLISKQSSCRAVGQISTILEKVQHLSFHELEQCSHQNHFPSMSTDVISYHCNSTCGISPVNIVGSDLVSFVHVSNCANLGFFYMYFATRPRPSQTAVACVLMCIIIFSLISSFVQVTSCLNLFRQRLSLHATPHCGWRTRVVDSEGGSWTWWLDLRHKDSVSGWVIQTPQKRILCTSGCLDIERYTRPLLLQWHSPKKSVSPSNF